MRLKAGKSLSSHYSSPAGHDEMGRKNGEIKFIKKNHNKLTWYITTKSEKPASEHANAFPFTAWRQTPCLRSCLVKVCGYFIQLEIYRKRKLLRWDPKMIPELLQSYKEGEEEAEEEVSLPSTSSQESGNGWTLTSPRKHWFIQHGRREWWAHVVLKNTSILNKGTHRIFL